MGFRTFSWFDIFWDQSHPHPNNVWSCVDQLWKFLAVSRKRESNYPACNPDLFFEFTVTPLNGFEIKFHAKTIDQNLFPLKVKQFPPRFVFVWRMENIKSLENGWKNYVFQHFANPHLVGHVERIRMRQVSRHKGGRGSSTYDMTSRFLTP